jgi:curved DNA-binding protein CbpA
MTERTHYVELGIAETATLVEIRTAYRRLVLLYHPDRSGDKNTTERFVKISEAYRTLADPKLRSEYDSGIRYRRDQAEKRQRSQQAPKASPQPTKKSAPRQVGDEAAKLQQAAALFTSGKYDNAESVLRLVLRTVPNSALAYAILGDISRQRGDIRAALTHYSYAVQFAPTNTGYQRRYEELLSQSTKVTGRSYAEVQKPKQAPTAIAAVVIALMLIIVSVSKDAPLFPDFGLIDTWSFTFLLMLFLSGIALGVSASIGGYVDHLRSLLAGSSGKLSPFSILAILGLVSFWLATITYFASGLAKDAFTYSASRAFGFVAAAALAFSLSAWMTGSISPIQAVLWGANLIWLGTLCGWAIADGFR